MRSLIASILAALVVAAHAPLPVPGGAGVPSRSKSGMSCCGAKACCIQGHTCGVSPACALTEAATARPGTPGRGDQPRILVGACGSESARLVPGSPDPGTLEPGLACSGYRAIVDAVARTAIAPPTRGPKPADPPPRA